MFSTSKYFLLLKSLSFSTIRFGSGSVLVRPLWELVLVRFGRTKKSRFGLPLEETQTCEAEVVECQFPFKYKNIRGEEKVVNYCTNDAIFEDERNPNKETENFFWCATRVNNDSTMKTGKWGRCELPCKSHLEYTNDYTLAVLWTIMGIIGIIANGWLCYQCRKEGQIKCFKKW